MSAAAHPSAGSVEEIGRARIPGSARQLLRAIGTGLSAAALLLAVALAALVIVIPMVVGGQALTVLTNSMAPTMPPGTLVIIKPTPIEDIKIGDVLTYQIKSGDPAVVSHRVVARTVNTNTGELTFITRGDNNDVDDPNPVTGVQIRGTVWYHLPLLGWVNSAVSGGSRGWIVPVAAMALFGYAAWAFTSALRERRRRRAAQAATAVGAVAADSAVLDGAAPVTSRRRADRPASGRRAARPAPTTLTPAPNSPAPATPIRPSIRTSRSPRSTNAPRLSPSEMLHATTPLDPKQE